MHPDLVPGGQFPDLELPDHNSVLRRLSELAEGDPLVLNFFRGWWCPKEQAFFKGLVRLQDEVEVAYTRMVSVSIDPPVSSSAFRAGLGARWTFLSDRVGATWRDWACWRRRTRSPAVCPDHIHITPGPDHPRCLQRLLVLGTADERGPPPGPAGDYPRRPAGLGGAWRELVLVREASGTGGRRSRLRHCHRSRGCRRGALWRRGRPDASRWPTRCACTRDWWTRPETRPGSHSFFFLGSGRRCSTTRPCLVRSGRCWPARRRTR